jgi:hypothetical protein
MVVKQNHKKCKRKQSKKLIDNSNHLLTQYLSSNSSQEIKHLFEEGEFISTLERSGATLNYLSQNVPAFKSTGTL